MMEIRLVAFRNGKKTAENAIVGGTETLRAVMAVAEGQVLDGNFADYVVVEVDGDTYAEYEA